MPPGPRLYCFRAARGAGHSTVLSIVITLRPDLTQSQRRIGGHVCDPASPPNPDLTVRQAGRASDGSIGSPQLCRQLNLCQPDTRQLRKPRDPRKGGSRDRSTTRNQGQSGR